MKKRRTAIHAELRKESKTFEGWLKYEVTIKNKNGSIEKVPAYGKDLQDALSRVVHDDTVKRVLPVFTKVPTWAWVFLWFFVIGIVTYQITEHQEVMGDWVGLIYVGTVGLLSVLSLSIANWFKIRNKSK